MSFVLLWIFLFADAISTTTIFNSLSIIPVTTSSITVTPSSTSFIIAISTTTILSSIAVTTSSTTIFQTSISAKQACLNDTAARKCINDLNKDFKLNTAISSSDVEEITKFNCGQQSCYTVFPKDNCSFVSTAANQTQTSLAFVCMPAGLTIVQNPTGCSGDLLEISNLFCNMINKTDCKKDIILKPYLSACTKPKPATPLPLLPNPIGPEGITAIVVIICLAITAILAGFFFWPKCHNPKAGLLPKKTTNTVKFKGTANPAFASEI